jgi:hypothetical protein
MSISLWGDHRGLGMERDPMRVKRQGEMTSAQGVGSSGRFGGPA